MGRQHGTAESKRQSKNRVLPLDHLQSGNQILQERHDRIVKEKAGPFGPAGKPACVLLHGVLSGNDQLVVDAENVGDGFRLSFGQLFVHLAIHNAVESDVAIVHDDADRLLWILGISGKCAVAVNGLRNPNPDVVVHRGRGENVNVVYDVLDARCCFYYGKRRIACCIIADIAAHGSYAILDI